MIKNIRVCDVCGKEEDWHRSDECKIVFFVNSVNLCELSMCSECMNGCYKYNAKKDLDYNGSNK